LGHAFAKSDLADRLGEGERRGRPVGHRGKPMRDRHVWL
jgi:hypothetical protein